MDNHFSHATNQTLEFLSFLAVRPREKKKTDISRNIIKWLQNQKVSEPTRCVILPWYVYEGFQENTLSIGSSKMMPREAYTWKSVIPFPFKLNGIWSWWQFFFRFSEPNGILFGSKLKEKLSPRSYPIQFERKWNNSFLSVSDRLASLGIMGA